MILEAVFLYIKPKLATQFEADFAKASLYISSINRDLFCHRLERFSQINLKTN
jgi:hypothetical protein